MNTLDRFTITLLAVTGLLPLMSGAAAAQNPEFGTPTETAMVRLCNETASEVSVALWGMPDPKAPSVFRGRGWWRVAPAQCINAMPALPDHVYSFAYANKRVWPPQEVSDDAVSLCVEYPGPYVLSITMGTLSNCPSKAVAKRFLRHNIPRKATTFTINYR
jgi:uncharacterized membrane protein